MNPITFFKQMLGVDPGSTLDTSIDVGIGVGGELMKAYNSFQMWKLQKRMTANEEQLQIIKNKIEANENEVFYKQEIFPLIVKELMDDDEDEKAKVIIDGFEHFIDNDMYEIERIYHYYDVLSELRYSDIMMLVEKYYPNGKSKDIRMTFKLPIEKEEISEEKAIRIYQKNKLVRLNLISEVSNMTDFGMKFVKFFALEDPEE